MQRISMLLAIVGLSLMSVAADYFLKRASEFAWPFGTKAFVSGTVLYGLSAFGWVYVLRQVKLATVGALFSVVVVVLAARRNWCDRLSRAAFQIRVDWIGLRSCIADSVGEVFVNVKRKNIYVAACDLGYGLFAGRDFQRGEFLFRFSGTVITSADAVAKGEAEGNPLQIGPTTYIDLKPPGVFINHSCDPKVGLWNVTEVYALRDIRFGQELRFDYSTTMSERRWTMRCQCQTAKCRGIVADFHELPPAIQERYFALGIVQEFIVQEMLENEIADCR